jgi:hypothetical protein
VVVEEPMNEPVQVIFGDARARMVPARLLVRDRWDSDAAAGIRIPSLWFAQSTTATRTAVSGTPEPYDKISAAKMLVWLKASADKKDFSDALGRWLDDLPASSGQ